MRSNTEGLSHWKEASKKRRMAKGSGVEREENED